jgi:hypothetical protein
MQIMSWGSSVSKVSEYRLYERATGVQSLAKAKDFSSSPCAQTNFVRRTQPRIQRVPGVLSPGL